MPSSRFDDPRFARLRIRSIEVKDLFQPQKPLIGILPVEPFEERSHVLLPTPLDFARRGPSNPRVVNRVILK